MRVPSVIRLLEYRRIPHQTRALSRKNILMRDRYTCQYCMKVLPAARTDARPRDPALSRRRIGVGKSGGLLPPCNNRKGSRTPEEAGLNWPANPGRSACIRAVI